MIFSDMDQTIFGFWKNIFRRDCQKCILRIHRNILGFLKNREHVEFELADFGKKINLQREKNPFVI